MRKAGVPDGVYDVIAMLYKDVRNLVVFSGEALVELAILRGIRQGCPLSGTLFAIAVSPLLGRIACGHGPV